jgi:hypothetical protein
MYLPRNNPRIVPTLNKRCMICGRFLFKRNLKENERYHVVGRFMYICHSCYVKKEKEYNVKRNEGVSTPTNNTP